MPNNDIQVQQLRVASVGGRLLVTVPWDRAEAFQSSLRKRGIGSTLHLDPRPREARLELWTNLSSADRVRGLLEGELPPAR